MKLVIVFIMAVAWVASGQGLAGDDVGRSQVIAATKDAVSNLLEEVARVPLSRGVTVGEFLRQTRSTEEMVKVLQRAQQMGGPRWIDEHTCQVELQIAGPVVAQQLKRAAAANPRWSPVPGAELDRAVRNWDERAFTATGTATSRAPAVGGGRNNGGGGGRAIDPWGGRFVPRVGVLQNDNGAGQTVTRDRWRGMGDAERDQAIAAAKEDAARRTLASVGSVPLARGTTVGDVLRVRSVADGMRDWLIARKPVRVDLNPDGEATVELAASPREAFETFRGLAGRQREVALPPDEGAWERARGEFERHMATPTGRSVAPAGAGRSAPAAGEPRGRGEDIGDTPINRTRKPAAALRERAPAWVDRRLRETGRGGSSRSSKLWAARAAESDAESKLRREIDQLPLADKTTLGQAAKDEPRLERAIGRALARARTSRANYNDDGSADVDVYLDLEVLWQELLRDAE
jgi:hypothetical protein